MERFEAMSRLFLLVETFGNEGDRLALLTLILQTPPLPPSAMGAVGGEAGNLARQIAKTGYAANWRTPPQHSQAMERLIHRLAVLLEAFLKMYQAAGSDQIVWLDPEGEFTLTWDDLRKVVGEKDAS